MEITGAMALDKAIRQHRKLMGLTQRDAAGWCGVGERFLSELERAAEAVTAGVNGQIKMILNQRDR